MKLVLDSGGLSALATDRATIAAWRKRGYWPPIVPAVVLTESLTGDHRRDFHVNRLVRTCQVHDVTEVIARHAASLRTQARKSGISAVDAVVAATADHAGGGIVLTSDLGGLRSLASHAINPVHVAPRHPASCPLFRRRTPSSPLSSGRASACSA